MLELPISVGVKGGVLASNSLYLNSLRLLDFPSAQILSEIMVSVGLAQNFAALRALAIEGIIYFYFNKLNFNKKKLSCNIIGIQKGHMALHARNIAMAAGTPTYLVEDVVSYMKTFNRISLDCAKIYLEAHELFTNIRSQSKEEKKEIPLSTFYVKIKPAGMLEPVTLHIAFDCWTSGPIHYSIEKKSKEKVNSRELLTEIEGKVFGEHDFVWLDNLFQFLDKVKLKRSKKFKLLF